MKLVTVANVKSYLDMSAVTTYDTLLGTLIDMTSKRFETYCNRLFESAARTKKYNAGRKSIFLPAYPISVVSSVTLDSSALTENSDYYVYYDEGWIEMDSEPTYYEPQQISITWTGGYTEGTVPDDLQFACMMQTAFVFRRRKDIGVSSISLPDGSMSINTPSDLLPEVKNILKAYKRNPGMI